MSFAHKQVSFHELSMFFLKMFLVWFQSTCHSCPKGRVSGHRWVCAMALAGRSIQPKRQWSDLDGLKRRAGRSQQTNTDDMIWYDTICLDSLIQNLMGMSLSVSFIILYIQVVPGRAGGGSFRRKKNYIAKKEFAYRMCARWPTIAMSKLFFGFERSFGRCMAVMSWLAFKWCG